MADSTVHNLCLFLPLWHVKSWMESWNELKCVSEIFYLIFNQCWVVDSSLVKRVLCKSSLLRSRFCLVTQRSSCDSSIQEVACPSGYKRSRPSLTIGGQQWQLLLLDVFFSFVRLVNNIKQIRHLNTLRVSSIKKSDCTLPTRNKKNGLRKKNDTQSDGFDITVEGLQTAIFYGNFLAFSS